MTADTALLTRTDRQRLLERVRELDDLADLMRQPGGLPSVPEPAPLHRAGRDITRERTTALGGREEWCTLPGA